jgi:hypothetical protein
LPFFFSAICDAREASEKMSSLLKRFIASASLSRFPESILFRILASIDNYKSKGEERPNKPKESAAINIVVA